MRTMKRLLLSVCLVGVVFAGNTRSPQSMPDPFATQPLNVARAASVPRGVSDQAKSQPAGFEQ